ncbi:MAG TPA: RnfABCDGE type electron transport complex subunit D [Candidatus Acidoferrales bacterium]|nr:RnfABCDGE type electron transport complex subunit D [Candidatus Acidoferrales bacterium]
MLGKALAWLDRAAFRPESLHPDLILGIAFLPPLAAGLLWFRLPALLILAAAVGLGGIAHLAARLARLPVPTSPLLASLVAVALIGPGTDMPWVLVAAGAAAGLEVARASLLPGLKVQPGIVVYAGLLLATRGALAQYLNTPELKPFPEPITLWIRFFGGTAAPIDPVKLWVGNVAGPVFATSLLALAMSLAWLWYARRLSPAVLVGFALGALLPIWLLEWNPWFHLDSGPAWFAAGIVLADRRLLPAGWAARALLGIAAGVIAVVLRGRGYGYGIEAVPVTVAGLQLLGGVIAGLVWLVANARGEWRRLGRVRLREAQMRVVEPSTPPLSKAS